jgi:DNA-binding IclR family transcriptional regulator
MFSLIDVLASREETVSLKEISEKTGLHPSTTHRILNDLATGRFVDRPEAGSYRLGMRLLELGNLVKARLNVRDAALAPMRELHKQIQQPVNLSCARATRSSTSSAPTASARACRWCAPSAAARRCTSPPPASCSWRPTTAARARLCHPHRPGRPHRNSITQLPLLERELAKARQYGMARDNEELELGVRCMAAGIYDDQAKLVAGLSISAPADRLDENWLAKLQATANEISTCAGHKNAAGPVGRHGGEGGLRRELPSQMKRPRAAFSLWSGAG